MTTAYTTYVNGKTIANQAGPTGASYPGFVTFDGIFDATQRNLAQNDTAAVIAIPIGTIILGVSWEILVSEGASRNFAIGDAGATNSWVTTTSGNTTVGVKGASGTVGWSGPITVNTASGALSGNTGGKQYTAADNILVLAVTSGGLLNLKLRIKAFGWSPGYVG